jgi:hypothetical protein
MTTNELLAYIFGDLALMPAVACGRWMAESARFRAFAETYRDKIRKKARGLRDQEGCGDLLFELAIAYRMLHERRFTIEYEKYGVGKRRGPDFTLTFKTHMVFNVEVKRLRAAAVDLPDQDRYELNKLTNAVCAKLGQMLPGELNLLALGADDHGYTESDLAAAMRLLKQHAEHKDDPFFQQRGFAGARDFLRCYQRLGAVLICYGQSARTVAPALWLNKEARRPLPDDLSILVGRLL